MLVCDGLRWVDAAVSVRLEIFLSMYRNKYPGGCRGVVCERVAWRDLLVLGVEGVCAEYVALHHNGHNVYRSRLSEEGIQCMSGGKSDSTRSSWRTRMLLNNSTVRCFHQITPNTYPD